MRTLRLAQVALQAEGLLLKRMARRLVRRSIFGAVAAVFALAMLVMLHVIGWLALTAFAGITAFWSSVIVWGVDVVLAGGFAAIAAGALPDPVETEARQLRDRSLAEMRNVALLGVAVGPVGRMAGRGALGGVRRLLFRRRR